MPRDCTVCQHPKRDAIDKALAGGTPQSEIIAEYRVSKDAVSRHKAAHLPLTLAKAEETREVERAKDVVAHALDVVQQLKVINGSTLAILKTARDEQDHELALKAIDRVQKQIELQAKLLGDLQPDGSVNITIQAEWLEVRAVILQALAPYPEARAAVAGALLEVEQ